MSDPHDPWRPYDALREHHTVVGTLWVLPEVESEELGNARDLLVHLPPSYDRDAERRYPVLYMQDGQNLFDRHTAFLAEWQVDETLAALAEEGLEAIVVGIPNTEARLDEYGPYVDARHGGGRGDAYLRWLVRTVKPLVDGRFRTLDAPAATGILGSSMGGLISLYAHVRWPGVFGLAGALSPSLFFGREAIFRTVRASARPHGRLYLDVGSEEGNRTWVRRQQGWPSDAVTRCRRMVRLLERRGYVPGEDLLYVEESGAGHNEAAWARRLPLALRFLLDGAEEAAAAEADAAPSRRRAAR